jgi:hypothetical protein
MKTTNRLTRAETDNIKDVAARLWHKKCDEDALFNRIVAGENYVELFGAWEEAFLRGYKQGMNHKRRK